ncbi:MAG TPA: peptidyl-prolyl cis-trans isomerase [Nitrospirota bacterium]|nr:peptidyl-prolyl cis-trans isomerase [Nitrospirota bacterium]
MKTVSSVVGCTLFLFLAVATASGREANQPDVISRGTETKTVPGDVLLTLKIPASSPLFARFPIAKVNDDVISVAELTKALVSSHESMKDTGEHAGKIDFTSILDRLINIRLITQEAANIGLDELPEFKSAMESKSRDTLRLLVMKDITKDVSADPAEVEKQFKAIAVEWKIKSLLFDKEADAKAMSDAVKTGKSFDELAKKALDDKKASGNTEGNYLKPKDLLPAIASVVSTMETGSVSPPITVQTEIKRAYTVLKLEDKRYPENPVARQQAEQNALLAKKNEVLGEYQKKLYAAQVTINEKLLNKLDYDSPKANFEKLLTDSRSVAEFKDGKTITVGDLTKALQDKFYHGLEQAARDKYINKEKRDVLNKIIDEQLISKEGVQRGLEKSDEYQDKMKEYRSTALFSMFMDKVVTPDLKVTEDDMRSYYKHHKGEYTDPEMLKMVSLDFGNKHDAEAALNKLKKGDDINWVRANAEGLVATTDEEGRPTNGTLVVTTKSLSPEMATAVAGAKAGDFRLSTGPEGRYSVLSIQEVIPARQQTFEEVQAIIKGKVVDAALVRILEDWFRKLRSAADIKVYLSSIGK